MRLNTSPARHRFPLFRATIILCTHISEKDENNARLLRDREMGLNPWVCVYDLPAPPRANFGVAPKQSR